MLELNLEGGAFLNLSSLFTPGLTWGFGNSVWSWDLDRRTREKQSEESRNLFA